MLMRIVCEGQELRTSARAIEDEGEVRRVDRSRNIHVRLRVILAAAAAPFVEDDREVDAVDFVVAVDVVSAKRAENA